MYDNLYSTYSVTASFFISFFVAYLITPLFRLFAIKLGFLDHPQFQKKSHAKPMPLPGGGAIIFSFFVSILLTTRLEKVLIPLSIGTTVLLVFGLIDDKMGMMPNIKLASQLIAALIVIRMGIKIDTIQNHYLSLIFTVFWIISITNSFNLLDNLNGLSSGIAGISAIFFGLLAFKNGQMFVATLSCALAGSCFGFLRHNFPRARIFMGDAGSMFLGFMLSCIAILGSWETEKITISLSLPLLILSYPIFDTVLVTSIRLLEKRSIFQGGKDHSSHILASLGLKKRRAVLYIFGICLFTGLCAYVMDTMSTTVGFGVMVIAYGFLLLLGINLLYIKLSKFRKKKRYRQKAE